jgi:hypothetical protein
MHGEGLIAGVFERLDWLAIAAVEEGNGSGQFPPWVLEALHHRIDGLPAELAGIGRDVLDLERAA